MTHWAQSAVFYHLYPLGLCGCPRVNNLQAAPVDRLDRLAPWLDQARALGATALYLGPVLESSAHGYDVADYFQVDRRLGDNAAMARLAAETRARGLRLVLEGVFHHVGRDFWAFRDVLAQGRASRFCDWFFLDWSGRSPFGDAFAYQGWNGCLDLVKLNLNHPEVKSHLWEAIAAWLRDWEIAGLRLDAADHLEPGFLRELGEHCRRLKDDFWLMGEVVHGDYQRWTKGGGLDAVTNYECYKGLFSSHNDANYFEIAHSLRRQSGAYGLYRDAGLYNFADNHDVDRVASRLKNPAHLFPLYCLLLTMPGIPSIYYGSEFGLTGVKNGGHDWDLRPALDLAGLRRSCPQPELAPAIERLARLRAACPALTHGDYRELAVSARRLVFSRRAPGQWLVVAVSAEDAPADQEIRLPEAIAGRLVDLLNPGQEFALKGGRARVSPLWPGWARVLEVRAG